MATSTPPDKGETDVGHAPLFGYFCLDLEYSLFKGESSLPARDPRSDARKLPKNLEASLNADEQWLKWAVDYHARVKDLYQPPYGEHAIVFKETQQVVGELVNPEIKDGRL